MEPNQKQLCGGSARDNVGAREQSSERGSHEILLVLARQTTWTVDHILSTPGLSDDGRIAILGGTAGRTEVCYFGRRSHGRWWGWPLHGRRRNRLRRFLDRRTLRFIADRRVTYRLRLARLSSHGELHIDTP